MVIDNTPKQDNSLKSTEYKDTTTSVITKTQLVADPDVSIVAANMADIKNISANITDILTQTREFNNNYKALETTNAVQVLENGMNTFNASLLGQINEVIRMKDSIVSLGAMTNSIEALNQVVNVMTNLNNNILTIQALAPITDDISIVAGLNANIELIVLLQTELKAIFMNLNELHTIYNYLPELLKNNEWINKYLESQNRLQFTDDSFFTAITSIQNNLQAILNISTNLAGLNELKATLDNAPGIIQNTKTELDNLLITFKTNTSDLVANYKKELASEVVNIKLELGKLMLELAEIISNLKRCVNSGNGGGTGVGYNFVAGTNIRISQNDPDVTISSATINAGTNIQVVKDEANNSYSISSSASGLTIDNIELLLQ